MSLSPEMGSSEADIASQGWGTLGRDEDLPVFTLCPRSGSGEAEFLIPGPWKTYFEGVLKILSAFFGVVVWYPLITIPDTYQKWLSHLYM